MNKFSKLTSVLTYIYGARTTISIGLFGSAANVLTSSDATDDASIGDARRTAYISVATIELLVATLSLCVIVAEFLLVGRCCQKTRHSRYLNDSTIDEQISNLDLLPNSKPPELIASQGGVTVKNPKGMCVKKFTPKKEEEGEFTVVKEDESINIINTEGKLLRVTFDGGNGEEIKQVKVDDNFLTTALSIQVHSQGKIQVTYGSQLQMEYDLGSSSCLLIMGGDKPPVQGELLQFSDFIFKQPRKKNPYSSYSYTREERVYLDLLNAMRLVLIVASVLGAALLFADLNNTEVYTQIGLWLIAGSIGLSQIVNTKVSSVLDNPSGDEEAPASSAPKLGA